MAYDRLRKKYGYPPDMPDEQVVRATKARPEFAEQSNEDFAQGIDAYEAQSSGAGAQGQSGAPPRAQPAPPQLAQAYDVARNAPFVGQAVRGVEAVAKAGGPLQAIQRTVEHGGKEVSETLSGLGQLAAGIPYAGALGIRNLARGAGVPENFDPTLGRETEQFTGSAAKIGRELPGQLLRQFAGEVVDPVGSFIEKPLSTTLDATMVAGLPAAATKLGANAAARVGQAGTAMRLARAGEAMEPMAAIRAGARGAFPGLAERSKVIGEMRDLIATSDKNAAIAAEAESKRMHSLFGGLSKKEREGATAIAAGLASPMKDAEKLKGAVAGYREGVAGKEAQRVARGEIGEETARLRAFQPLRVLEGGEQQIAREASRATDPRAMSSIKAQTEGLAQQGFDPAYVPTLPKKDVIKDIVGFFKKNESVPPAKRPGYLERSTGAGIFAEGTERDLSKIAARHSEADIRNSRNIEILSEIAKKPWARKITNPAQVDWTTEALVAPGEYARNVSNTIKSGGEALSGAMASKDPVRALDEGLRASVSKAPGAAGEMGTYYAIPKAAAKEFMGQTATAPQWARIIFDKPNAFQRWAVLTLRPGFYVNNVVGGAGLAALSGAKPSSFVKAADKGIIEQIPKTLRGSGFAAVEAPHSGTPVLRNVSKASNALNESVDEYFRRASFISEVERRAASESVKNTGKVLEKGLSFAEKMDRLGPEGVQAAVKHVNRFLNDYTRQTPFQRQVLRRVFPFQSFTVHMARLASRLPLENPIRANLLAKSSELANEYQQDRFAQAGHEDLPPYRKAQFPVSSDEKGNMTTFGTAGFNPTSGLGTSGTEFQNAPGLGALAEAGAGQSGPLPRAILEQITGRQGGTGRTFTSPNVAESYGGGSFFRRGENGEVAPAAEPRPGLLDILRSQSPQAALLEKLLMKNETYDLWADPQGFGGPVERNFGKKGTRPRRYSGEEALMGYLGLPFRNFESDELEYPESVQSAKKAAEKELKRRESARKGGSK